MANDMISEIGRGNRRVEKLSRAQWGGEKDEERQTCSTPLSLTLQKASQTPGRYKSRMGRAIGLEQEMVGVPRYMQVRERFRSSEPRRRRSIRDTVYRTSRRKQGDPSTQCSSLAPVKYWIFLVCPENTRMSFNTISEPLGEGAEQNIRRPQRPLSGKQPSRILRRTETLMHQLEHIDY